MTLTDVVRPGLIRPDLHATCKESILVELATCLSENLAGVSHKEIVHALQERERQGSTAIGEGVAIPHGKLDGLHRPIACLGRSIQGVAFGSADGQPVHIIFALLTSADTDGTHLKLLARFCRVFRHADIRAQFMAAETADGIYRTLENGL